KTIAVGAGLPASSATPNSSSAMLRTYDFSAAVAALRSDSAHALVSGRVGEPDTQDGDVYRNAIMIRGAKQDTFIQRIPVPMGMWHPFGASGVPLNLLGRGVLRIGDQ